MTQVNLELEWKQQEVANAAMSSDRGQVAELADARDLGSRSSRSEGSTPSLPTIFVANAQWMSLWLLDLGTMRVPVSPGISGTPIQLKPMLSQR